MNFSIVVPTYNRKNDLEKLLQSILEQYLFPKEIIIIDDGNLERIFIRKINSIFKDKQIKIVYYQKNHKNEPKGAAVSRNIGMELAKENIVFILDDDLILEKEFFINIIQVWKENNNSKLIGVGGIIKNNRRKKIFENIYNKIFTLSSNYNWDITGVGFQIWNDFITNREIGYYIHGGVASYNKNKILSGKLMFRALSSGQTYLEDIDFCLRAKKKGFYFIIEPTAKSIHNHCKLGRDSKYMKGFKSSQNRKLIFNKEIKKTQKNYILFFWSNFGWLLRQLLVGHFATALGMLVGLLFYKKNEKMEF